MDKLTPISGDYSRQSDWMEFEAHLLFQEVSGRLSNEQYTAAGLNMDNGGQYTSVSFDLPAHGVLPAERIIITRIRK